MARTWDVVRGEGPVVATAIHNGHDMRSDLAELVLLREDERRREEDPYTDVLTEVAPTRIVVRRSRFEIDLNRDRDEAICVVPEDCWDLRVWKEPLADELLHESRALYERFYRDFEALLADVERGHGRFVVLDLHSYNHRRAGPHAPPADLAENPEVNVGTGSMDRRRWGRLVDRFIADLSRRGLDVRENVKFRGRRMARFVHETFPETGCCLAVEFKKTFMDEHTGDVDHPRLQELKEALASTLPGLRQALR
ncbi:MAG: N-formylglutamate amidohydrolase [Actinomycetota bacterium]|nr:N-formylglutamate amidohydrolase [Actinomycetota bacterium]